MKFKAFLDSIFSYKPYDSYDFSLPGEEGIKSNFDSEKIENNHQLNNQTTSANEEKIYPSLKINQEFLQTKYNILINSDIVLREFTLNARGKQYNSFIIYIDGMIDTKLLDDFILKPLMLRNKSNTFDGSQNKVISEAVTNNITIRKVKKFDLASYVKECLLPQNAIKKISTFSEVYSGVNCR